jgi:hypothetical protein
LCFHLSGGDYALVGGQVNEGKTWEDSWADHYVRRK